MSRLLVFMIMRVRLIRECYWLVDLNSQLGSHVSKYSIKLDDVNTFCKKFCCGMLTTQI